MTVPADDTCVNRRAAMAFAIRAASAAIAYLSHLLLARWLSLENYGLFAATWTWLLIAGGTLPLGLNVAVVSRLPGYIAAADAARARGLAATAVGLTFIVSGVVSAVAIALITWQPAVIQGALGPLALLAVLLLPLLALGEVNEGLSRAMGWMGTALVPAYIVRPLLMLAAAGLLLMRGYELDAAAVLACALLAAVATTMAQTAWVAFNLLKATGWGPPRLTVRTWMFVSLPMLASEICEMLLSSMDLLLVAAWLGASETGVYFAAQRSIALVAFVSFAVGAATASSIAGAIADKQRLSNEIRYAATLSFWPTLAGALVLVGAAPLILGLFGSRFTEGTAIVAILAVGFVARSATGPAELVLYAIGAERACAAILGVHLALGLALNAALIPAFGIVGAAVATAATMVSLSIAFAAYCWVARGIVMLPSSPLPQFGRFARAVRRAA
jgi:O-antigen/teichoic acid export membrane protein